MYCEGLRRALRAAEIEMVDVPKELGKSNWPFPADANWVFLGKDLREAMRRRWNDEIERDFAEGEGTYNWVKREAAGLDGVVVWNDEYPRWRGVVIAAGEAGLPTIEICHGSMYLPQHGDWRARKRARWQLGSRNYAEWARLLRCRGERAITGSVEQDPYAVANVPALRATARGELEIPMEAPVVCVLTDASFQRSTWQDPGLVYHSTVEVLRAARVAQGILRGLQVVVKIHPYERDEYGNRITAVEYEGLLRKLGYERDYAIVDDPLVLAVAGADLVLGHPSSAFATALCLGIPCVCLPHAPFFPREWFRGRGVHLTDESGLVESLVTLLTPGGREMPKLIGETKKGAEYFGGHGDAAWRSARAIGRIIAGGTPDDYDRDYHWPAEPAARGAKLADSGPQAG